MKLSTLFLSASACFGSLLTVDTSITGPNGHGYGEQQYVMSRGVGHETAGFQIEYASIYNPNLIYAPLTTALVFDYTPGVSKELLRPTAPPVSFLPPAAIPPPPSLPPVVGPPLEPPCTPDIPVATPEPGTLLTVGAFGMALALYKLGRM